MTIPHVAWHPAKPAVPLMIVPSPKSQSNAVIVPSGDEVLALNDTSVPLTGLVGDIVNPAVKLPAPAETVTWCVAELVSPVSSVTVSTTLFVAADEYE